MDEYFTIRQAAEYAKMTQTAIYRAIVVGRLKAEKKIMESSTLGKSKNMRRISRQDLDAYRASKYIRENKVVDGEKVFDLEKGTLSALQASKILTETLGKKISQDAIYSFIHSGRIKANKKGRTWIIHRDEITKMYREHSEKNVQMTF